MLPDYMLLAVCAVRGLSRLGREHLAVALALEVPFAVVLTKVDLADQASLDRTLTQIRCGIHLPKSECGGKGNEESKFGCIHVVS